MGPNVNPLSLAIGIGGGIVNFARYITIPGGQLLIRNMRAGMARAAADAALTAVGALIAAPVAYGLVSKVAGLVAGSDEQNMAFNGPPLRGHARVKTAVANTTMSNHAVEALIRHFHSDVRDVVMLDHCVSKRNDAPAAFAEKVAHAARIALSVGSALPGDDGASDGYGVRDILRTKPKSNLCRVACSLRPQFTGVNQVYDAAFDSMANLGWRAGVETMTRRNPGRAEAMFAAIDALATHSFDVVDVPDDRDFECDACRDSDFWTSEKLPTGEFFRSGLVRAGIRQDLGGGVHGEVRYGTLPLRVSIAAGQSPARAAIALAHELAHVANRTFKLGMNHDQVHQIGVYYASEGLPALRSLEKHIGTSVFA